MIKIIIQMRPPRNEEMLKEYLRLSLEAQKYSTSHQSSQLAHSLLQIFRLPDCPIWIVAKTLFIIEEKHKNEPLSAEDLAWILHYLKKRILSPNSENSGIHILVHFYCDFNGEPLTGFEFISFKRKFSLPSFEERECIKRMLRKVSSFTQDN